MNATRLEDLLATLRTTAPQRWALGGLAVAAIVGALATIVVGTDQPFGWFVLFVISLGAISAAQPGWNTGATVIALVVIEWMAADADVTDVRTVVVATCLFVFHGALALMAVTPHSTPVDAAVARTWAVRSVLVVAATLAVWALVRVFEGRDPVGDRGLTVTALVAIGLSAIALRVRAADRAEAG